MAATPANRFCLDHPAAGAGLAPGRHTLRGWVLPGPGEVFADLRARAGGRIFPGVLGLPRPDLAAHFLGDRAAGLAGFQVSVDLAPGRADVEFEALSIDGGWHPVGRAAWPIEGAPVALGEAGGEVRWLEFTRILREMLRRDGTDGQSPDQHARDVLAGLPHPRDLLHPAHPFHGFLDEPVVLAGVQFGRLGVAGHVFHETARIRRVLATVDLQACQELGYGGSSPGPAAHYAAFAQARNCGFSGLVDVPAQLPNPISLRLYAELEDGSLHLCQVARICRETDEAAKRPFAVRRAAAFRENHEALRRALTAGHLRLVEDDDLTRGLARLEDEYDRSAPPVAGAGPPPAGAPLPAAAAPRRVLLATHSLGLEGAPLFLLAYARHLAAAGTVLEVLSPEDGPLRAQFEELGARVCLVDPQPFFAATSGAQVQVAAAALARESGMAATDLVIANTFTTFWAVHAAKAAGRPVLLYVHESTTPAVFYGDRVPPAVVAAVEQAFTLADCVSFTTAATRRHHLHHGRTSHYRLTPGWIDVTALDRWRAAHPREDLRRQFNLQPGELLVSNVGTICSRKGQHMFVRAVDLLWRRHPDLASRCRFVMLGARGSAFDDMLRNLLGQLGRANLDMHHETADHLPYYAAADLFVCSSYEESSPRVILETMACAVPILSSDVHGVAELVRPGLEAVLVPPGDTAALCEGMATLLRAPATGRALAARARTRVESLFRAELVLPQHTALAAAVAAGHFTSIRTQ